MFNNWFKNSAAGKAILVLVLVCMVFTAVFPSYVEAISLPSLGQGASILGGFAVAGLGIAGTIAATPALIIGGTLTGLAGLALWAFTPSSCSTWFSTECFAYVYTQIVKMLVTIGVAISSLSGKLFDITLRMGLETYSAYASAPIMATLWRTLRDLANLCFIFILLYVALRTMLGLSTSPMKLVFNVLIAALLINFSFAITRVVVDASNVPATAFYNILTHDGTESTAKLVLEVMSIDDLANYDSLTPTDSNVGAKVLLAMKAPMVTAAYATVCLLFIAAMNVMFFALSIMMLLRTIALILLIIASPVAFLAFAMPDSLGGLFKSWGSNLLRQAFWLPIVLLLLVLGLIISTQLHAEFAKAILQSAGNVAKPDEGFKILALYTITNTITLAFLFLPLVVAKSMGAAGADFAIGWGKKLTGMGILGLSSAAAFMGKGVANVSGLSAGLQRFENSGIPGTKFIGTQLRNLPYYGRDLGKAGLDTAAGLAKSTGLDVLPTSKDINYLPDAYKSSQAYNKGLAKERLDAQNAAKVKEAQGKLSDLDRRLLTEQQIVDAGAKAGSNGAAVMARLRADRTDAQNESKRIRGSLGSSWYDLPETVRTSNAGLFAANTSDFKKWGESMTNDAHLDLIGKAAKVGNAKAAVAAIDDDRAAGMTDAQLTPEILQAMTGKQLGGVITSKARFAIKPPAGYIPRGDEALDSNGYLIYKNGKNAGKVKFDQTKRSDFIVKSGTNPGLKGAQLAEMDPETIAPFVPSLDTDQLADMVDTGTKKEVSAAIVEMFKDSTTGDPKPEWWAIKAAPSGSPERLLYTALTRNRNHYNLDKTKFT